jgi:Glucokinase
VRFSLVPAKGARPQQGLHFKTRNFPAFEDALIGGVTLAGGILPRIVEFCDPARFRAAFERKTPYGELMRAIGTRLIVAENTVFSGMAKIAAAPQDFAINYAQRAGR